MGIMSDMYRILIVWFFLYLTFDSLVIFLVTNPLIPGTLKYLVNLKFLFPPPPRIFFLLINPPSSKDKFRDKVRPDSTRLMVNNLDIFLIQA